MGGGAPLDAMAACARVASRIARDVGLVQAPPSQSLATHWPISCTRWRLEDGRRLAPLLRVVAGRWWMDARAGRAASRKRCTICRLLRMLLADAGRSPRRRWPAWSTTLAARWLRAMRSGRVTLRAASCAAAAIFVVVAPPSPAAAPASLRRCRDGWSDFF
ncbi:hypothetical protein F511_45140 [Dorcoceras hygrometricum]|uniref:Uncharacterized protein n=1 Tax=Dorcoceras hygrometricum TaxID=472368 RepID=A0A2Z6ZWV3_9LAMI|nr:hypothetical protein F511_45140 [Dorcoceras hygrometricum]